MDAAGGGRTAEWGEFKFERPETRRSRRARSKEEAGSMEKEGQLYDLEGTSCWTVVADTDADTGYFA
jgi:hypothetical protein